jgi:hypothetical protein
VHGLISGQVPEIVEFMALLSTPSQIGRFTTRGRRRLTAWVAGVLLVTGAMALAVPTPAKAMDRNVKALLVAGSYGMVGGTLLGALSLPFTQNVRSMFVGTSLGLYLGLAVGVYYVVERDNPGNPLRPRKSASLDPRDHLWDPRDMKVASDQSLRELASERPVGELELARVKADSAARLEVPVLRFD